MIIVIPLLINYIYASYQGKNIPYLEVVLMFRVSHVNKIKLYLFIIKKVSFIFKTIEEILHPKESG